MAIAIVPILMIIIGVLINFMSDKGKDVGRACYWAGFIGLAIEYAHRMVHVG